MLIRLADQNTIIKSDIPNRVGINTVFRIDVPETLRESHPVQLKPAGKVYFSGLKL